MQRILVAIDFSGDSFNALEHAILMANVLGTHLRMVHVNHNDEFVLPYDQDFNESQKPRSIKEYLSFLLKNHLPKYKVENGIFDYKIRKGKVYVEISNQAHYDDSLLIICGTHGVSGFEEYLLGSNAFRIVSQALCPVLTIRHGFMPEPIKTIVLPIDVTNQSRRKVPFAIDLATAFNANIHVLGVHETSGNEVVSKITQYVDQVYELITNKGIKVEKKINTGTNITKITIEYAKLVNAGMIIIMTEQTESSENIWLGPYARQMVNHSHIPILCIHPKDQEKYEFIQK
ncbi:MAG: universal stress protein [Bacteroidota bacterium]|nr:universal stress protein [Bacteroidota bacterium]